MIVAILPVPGGWRSARPTPCAMSILLDLGSANMMLSIAGRSKPSRHMRELVSTRRWARGLSGAWPAN